MKIVTVNIPESYIEAINKLIGEDGLFPSRSELIRCAVREFLIKELKLAKTMPGCIESEDYDKEKYARVPILDSEGKKIPAQSFKTYKIIKRLEF
ncbi:MAG: ribbon-helix-helix protein, CopG family [Promethearchaeota archaeon]|nr:MAG: ribbon-helix-helix protein, CopG family [Candidatus Lokiarchaeota archaeon]